MVIFSSSVLPVAILNELLHPGPSGQRGTLGNMLKKIHCLVEFTF